MATLFRKQKRGGGYYPQLYARVYDGRRWREISTRCTTREAAQKVADDRERDLVNPGARAAREATFGAAVTRKLDHDVTRCVQGEIAEDTLAFYRSKAAQLVAHFGAETLLSAIGAGAGEVYAAARLDAGVGRHTVTKELTTFRQVMRQAKRRGDWKGDVEDVMPELWKVGYTPRRRALGTEEEADRMLAELPEAQRAWVCLALVIGGRASEVERVTMADVGAWTVRVRGTKTEASDATLPILPHVWRYWLEAWAWLERHGKVRRWLSSNRCRDLAKACERAGIDRTVANDFRRTAATWIRVRTGDGQLAGLFLRHADSTMVDRVYARLAGVALGEAIGRRVE